jgi:Rod binding domain-containing protein
MKPPVGPVPIGGSGASAGAAASPRARLRVASHQLEGMFVRQLFEAMRKSTQTSSSSETSPGGEMFTSMLDDALADRAAQKFDHGIGEALYRQLSRGLPPEPAESAGKESGTASKPGAVHGATDAPLSPEAASVRRPEPDGRP